MKTSAIIVLVMVCLLAGCHGVHIKSNIPGACVYIDDVKTDYVTPCKIRDKVLGKGMHKIELRLDGYKAIAPTTQSVEVFVAPASIVWSIILPIPMLIIAAEEGFVRSKPKELQFILERSSSFDQNTP